MNRLSKEEKEKIKIKQKGMVKELLNYFYKQTSDKEQIYLRIRGSVEEPILKTYYGGVKLFDCENGKIILNASLFLPNSVNSFKNMEYALNNEMDKLYIPKNVEDDYNILRKLGFNLAIKSELFLPFSSKKLNDDVLKGRAEAIFASLRDSKIKIDLKNIKKNRRDEEVGFIANIDQNEPLDFATIFKLKILSYTKTGYEVCLEDGKLKNTKKPTGFKSLEITPIMQSTNFTITKDNMDSLIEVMSSRAQVYSGIVIEKEEIDFALTRTDSEKEFQQRLFSLMQTKDKRLNMANRKNSPFMVNDMPFELEYTMYASIKDMMEDNDSFSDEQEEYIGGERSRSNKKGRIDNIFIDYESNPQRVKFVELKMDDGVIGGTNGLHKHLLDMANCLMKNNKFKEEFARIVNTRDDILKDAGIIMERHPKLETDFQISYDIICGYSEKVSARDYVIEAIESIKDKKITDEAVILKKGKLSLESYPIDLKTVRENLLKNDDNPSNSYADFLLDFTIKDYLEFLNNGGNVAYHFPKCPVRIFVVDQNYENYEKLEF